MAGRVPPPVRLLLVVVLAAGVRAQPWPDCAVSNDFPMVKLGPRDGGDLHAPIAALELTGADRLVVNCNSGVQQPELCVARISAAANPRTCTNWMRAADALQPFNVLNVGFEPIYTEPDVTFGEEGEDGVNWYRCLLYHRFQDLDAVEVAVFVNYPSNQGGLVWRLLIGNQDEKKCWVYGRFKSVFEA